MRRVFNIIKKNPESLVFFITASNILLNLIVVKLSFSYFSDDEISGLNSFLIITTFSNAFLTLSAQSYYLSSNDSKSYFEVLSYYVIVILFSFFLAVVSENIEYLGVGFSILSSFLLISALRFFEDQKLFLYFIFSTLVNFTVIVSIISLEDFVLARIKVPILVFVIIFIFLFKLKFTSPLKFIKYGLKLIPYSIASYVLFNFIRFNEFIYGTESYVVFYLAFITLFTLVNLVADTIQKYYMLQYKIKKKLSNSYFLLLLISLIAVLVFPNVNLKEVLSFISLFLFNRILIDIDYISNILFYIFFIRILTMQILIKLHFDRSIFVLNSSILVSISLGFFFAYLFFSLDKFFLIHTLATILTIYAFYLLSYSFIYKKIRVKEL